MKTEEQRINNIVGQLEGIKKMIESDSDCFQVLTQIKAVKSALNSFSSKYLSERFTDCIKKCNSDDVEDTCKNFINEIIK